MEITVTKQQPLNPPAAPVERPRFTDEERAENARLLISGMGWGTPAPAAAPAAPAPAAAPVTAPVLTSEEVIQRTASETARHTALAVAEVFRPKEAIVPAARVAEFEMTQEDAEDYQIIQYMEGSGKWPTYKGKSALFLEYVKKHYAYQAQWLAANAGKEFDTEAPEHAEWYTANQPDIDPDQLADGKIDMKVDQRVEHEYNTRIKPKEDAQAAEDALAEHLPAITDNVTSSVLKFARDVDPELAKLIADAEGKPSISQETVKVLIDTDPIAGDIMDEIVRLELRPLLTELEKTGIRDDNGVAIFKLNPAQNKVHAAIDQFRQRTERDIMDGPAENRIVDGKQFVPISKFQDLLNKAVVSGTDAEKTEKLAEIDRTYWTINMDHVEASIVKTCAAKAKTKIEKANKLARSKYKVEDGQPAPIQQPPPGNAPAPAAQSSAAPISSNGKPNPPSLSGQSDLVTSGRPGGTAEKTVGETVTKSLWG